MHIGILASHPIQYHAPWYRALARDVDLSVFFAHRQSAAEQGQAGFGVAFDWDSDLLSGYSSEFLPNRSRRPGVYRFFGCDTPDIADRIRLGRFDGFVVTGWNLKSYWQAVVACRKARVPVLVRGDSQLRTPRSLAFRMAKQVSHRILCSRFDGFLVVGQRNAEYLTSYGVARRRMFSVLHNVDNEWFADRAREARPGRSALRASWGVRDDTLVALFVGKLIADKKPDDLLLACARLAARGVDIVPVFVGAGPLQQGLEKQARALGIEARFAGFRNQSELPRHYVAADVLVLPSGGTETWGLVVNEAMACGVPAIVSDAVGCAPDLIAEGETGYTYSVGSVKGLATRLEQCRAAAIRRHDWRPALLARIALFSPGAAAANTIAAIAAQEMRHE